MKNKAKIMVRTKSCGTRGGKAHYPSEFGGE